jgi:tetratricopeptide (TPR) repeat protein
VVYDMGKRSRVLRWVGNLTIAFVAATVVAAPRGDPPPADRDPLARLDSLLAANQADQAATEAARLLTAVDLPAQFKAGVTQRQCVALQAAGRLEEALPVCEEAVLLALQEGSNHQNLGTCLQRLGQLGRAAGELEQALELAPARTDWRLQYARILLDLGARRESSHQIEMAAADCPSCPGVDRALADHALRTGRPALAIAPLQRLLLAGSSAPLRERLVQAYWDAGLPAGVDSTLAEAPLESLSGLEITLLLQADRAQTVTTRARRLAPGGVDFGRVPEAVRREPRFWALVCELCLLGADPAAALSAIDAALALAPQDPRWHQNRAAVLVKLGREKDAAAALARAKALGGGT